MSDFFNSNQAGDFNRQLDDFAAGIDSEIVTAQAALAGEALESIVARTPEGPLRANWQVTTESAATQVVSSVDESGAAAISAGRAVISGLTGAEQVFISNPLPEAFDAEYGTFIAGHEFDDNQNYNDRAEKTGQALAMVTQTAGELENKRLEVN